MNSEAGKRQIIKAMAVIRRPRDGALLVSESADPWFQRPLGGHVEFGEYAADTIYREFLEEIGQVVTNVRLLGVLENIFGSGVEPQAGGELCVRHPGLLRFLCDYSHVTTAGRATHRSGVIRQVSGIRYGQAADHQGDGGHQAAAGRGPAGV